MSEDDPLIGTMVAERYRVSRRLGAGGMGVVYLAAHEGLRKQVALKVLGTKGRIDQEAITRFEREAIASANLRHPNIAESVDFGRLPDGSLYLVMEYVEGETLRRLLAEQGGLAPSRAVAILEQVGAAIATAHARDVVHRDLKPENVIVESVREPISGRMIDRVKVIDFGIARLRSATFGGGGTGLTAAGTVLGTPEYMAPEQVMGQAVDARADQYALGILAFELLTGKPPFKADDVGQLMMMHVGAPVPAVRESVPSLSPELEGVVTKMLGKLPEERFDSVASAVQALTAAASAPPGATPSGNVVAAPPSAPMPIASAPSSSRVVVAPASNSVRIVPAPLPTNAYTHGVQAHAQPHPTVHSPVAPTWALVAIAGLVTTLVAVLIVILVVRSGDDTEVSEAATPTTENTAPAPSPSSSNNGNASSKAKGKAKGKK